MYRDSISESAQVALEDIFLLEKFAKENEISLAEAVMILISNFGAEEQKQYGKDLIELKDKKYISSDVEICDGHIVLSKMQIGPSAKLYKFKYFEQTGEYTMKQREHERTVDETLLKISNSGTYILITAIIMSICTLLDTLVNIYNAFH